MQNRSESLTLFSKLVLTPIAWWGFLPSHGCLHHPIFARHIYRRTLGRKKKQLSLPPLQDLLCFFPYILPVEPTCFSEKKHWHHPGTGLQGHNQSSRVAQLFHVPGAFCLGFFGHQQVRDNSDTSHEVSKLTIIYGISVRSLSFAWVKINGMIGKWWNACHSKAR